MRWPASLDRDALAAEVSAAGSTIATHVTPCEVEGGCGGAAWYGFNAPASSAALAAADFDLKETYPLHVPDQPVPGLPDPAGLAAAVQAQLEENVGVRTRDRHDAVADYLADLATGELDGLYLGGVGSTIADPEAFLEPLFRKGLKSTPATRTPKAAAALGDAAGDRRPGGARGRVRARPTTRSATPRR